MDLKQIKELIALMDKAGLKKLRIKDKSGFEVDLESQEEPQPTSAPTHHPVYHEQRFPTHHHIPPRTHAGEEEKKEVAEGKYVTSPMVGTFYSSSSPDDPTFVKVGDRVDENTVVCIIEAMKVMNEVKAGVSGTVAEICVENAHPVEFGTKIFRIV